MLARCFDDQSRMQLAAIDSTGFEPGQVSPSFVRRRSRGHLTPQDKAYQTTRYTCFPKLHAVCACASHLIRCILSMRGPHPDVDRLPRVMRSSSAHPPMRLAADAGYDSEANHVYLREQLGVESIIPPRHGRPSTKWRRLMKQQFDADAYGQRWQIETVFSMIKRRLGCVIRERRHHAQCRAMRLLALAHNCMILLRSMGSATEHLRPLFFVFRGVLAVRTWASSVPRQ